MVTKSVLIVILLRISAYSDEGNPLGPFPVVDGFAIYFLKDTTTTMRQILNTNIADLQLADKPWLVSNDIEFYDWSSHCIYLKKDKRQFFPNYQFLYRFPQSWTDRPYVVVANKIPCYAGYFLTEGSFDMYPAPYIGMAEVGYYPEDIVASDWPFLSNHKDPNE